nr:uncharacterized protein LOC113817674 [Penaeus vannamei]
MIVRLPLLLLPLVAADLAQQAPWAGPSLWPANYGDRQPSFADRTVGSPEQADETAQDTSGAVSDDDLRCDQRPIYEARDVAHLKSCSGANKRNDKKPIEEEMEGEGRPRGPEVFILFLNVNCTPGTGQHPICYSCMCSRQFHWANEAHADRFHDDMTIHATVDLPGERRAGTDKKAAPDRRKGRRHDKQNSRKGKGASSRSASENERDKRDSWKKEGSRDSLEKEE